MSYKEFKEAYIEALLWSEIDDNDGSHDNFEGCEHELDDDALAAIDQTCGEFWAILASLDVTDHARAGHSFCFTRNRHGAGFWDGDWTEPSAAKLTEYAHAAGEMNLVRIDDDTISTC